MARRRIGQSSLQLSSEPERRSALDDLAGLIEWQAIEIALSGLHAATKGEPAWPPLALFKAMLIAVWDCPGSVDIDDAFARGDPWWPRRMLHMRRSSGGRWSS